MPDGLNLTYPIYIAVQRTSLVNATHQSRYTVDSKVRAYRLLLLRRHVDFIALLEVQMSPSAQSRSRLLAVHQHHTEYQSGECYL